MGHLHNDFVRNKNVNHEKLESIVGKMVLFKSACTMSYSKIINGQTNNVNGANIQLMRVCQQFVSQFSFYSLSTLDMKWYCVKAVIRYLVLILFFILYANIQTEEYFIKIDMIREFTNKFLSTLRSLIRNPQNFLRYAKMHLY